MKNITLVASVLLLLAFVISDVNARRHGKPVTPYGDFCQQCTKYGACKSIMSHDDSQSAMLKYYNKKGLTVELVKKRGRFIRANIKDKDNVIDVIIFDRRTGRVRSIY